MSRFTSNGSWGAQYIFAASGLMNDLKLDEEDYTNGLHAIQAGEIYLRVPGDIYATGYFREAYPSTPYVTFTPCSNPSGYYWMSASGTSSFTIRFIASPNEGDVGSGASTFPYRIGTWRASPWPHT